MLGDEAITALTDDTTRARIANRIYAISRDALLRVHIWRFALKRVALARLATTPAWGFDYEYQLPADCLRVVTKENEDDYPFKVESDHLLTDESTANILYVARITDTAAFDPLFTNTLIAFLAYEFANVLTGKQSLAAQVYQAYQNKLAAAIGADTVEGRIDVFTDTDFTDVRR